MKRIAIVVHRCHESIAAGSEALAWQYARLLNSTYAVDVLTTTAVDYVSWANVLPAGLERRQGITVRRFPVTVGRSGYWHGLHQRLREDYNVFARPEGRLLGPQCGAWTVALQEEFIRHQGPHSEPLLRYLESHGSEYHTVLFITYVYPTTYFGLGCVSPEQSLLVPTLHDEPAAHLEAYRSMAQGVRSVLWLTEAEQRLGTRLWGPLPGRVVAMPVHTEPVAPAREPTPYLLYCGRIDEEKGCGQLIQSFLAFKESHPSDLRLVLTGDDQLGVSKHPALDCRGFVSAEEMYALMAGATLFVMPSRLESFSLATLEALAQGTPVLVNGACEILTDHVQHSGAGRTYRDHAGFRARLEELLAEPARLKELGAKGREYVLAHYTDSGVRQRLVEAIAGTVPIAIAA
jgi:glycosyltransferase involved in cell wall biosynthesis